MTRVPHSSHTEKLGVAEVIRICAKARTIFRQTSTDDVGIDGFIELVENGAATGVIAGVQIKSGGSFLDDTGTRFTFKADQEHFGYWARCSFPVIGIVFSPDYEKAIWLDITSLSSDERIVNGPYSLTIEYSDKTAFTPYNILSEIQSAIYKYAYQRRNLWQIRALLEPKRQRTSLYAPTIEVSSQTEQIWYELIEVFLGFSSTDADIADVGFRLSWYFPTVSEKLQQVLKDKIAQIDDFSLIRIFCVIYELNNNSGESTAELIIDLLTYIPDLTQRIEALLASHKIPLAYAGEAIQTIEILEEQYREDLWQLYQN
ncbi:MAG: DUF4365 domain-containing protein [Nostoc sp.]|uniref:DUF4365 domain-containing protein n=1 Tax=Nostoc sp. TaxID=1180 RepID=UPI002FFC7550